MANIFEKFSPRDQEHFDRFNDVLTSLLDNYSSGQTINLLKIQDVVTLASIHQRDLNNWLSRAIFILFYTKVKEVTPLTTLKYPTFDEFKVAYSCAFPHDTEENELIKLWHTANWMHKIVSDSEAKRNKGFVMYVAPKVVEGWEANYVTGGGASLSTRLRVKVYERESNTRPAPRQASSRLHGLTNQALPTDASSTTYNVIDDNDDGNDTDTEDNDDDGDDDNSGTNYYLIDDFAINPMTHKYFKGFTPDNHAEVRRFDEALMSYPWQHLNEYSYPSIGEVMKKAKFVSNEDTPDRLFYTLWILYYRKMMNETSTNSLIFPTIEGFKQRVFDVLPQYLDSIELEKLWHNANWMHELYKNERVPKKGVKKFFLEIVPRVVEGFDASYATGSGAKETTKNRVAVYEMVTGNRAVRRKQSSQVVPTECETVALSEDFPVHIEPSPSPVNQVYTPPMNNDYVQAAPVNEPYNRMQPVAMNQVYPPSNMMILPNTYIHYEPNQTVYYTVTQPLVYQHRPMMQQTVYPPQNLNMMIPPSTTFYTTDYYTTAPYPQMTTTTAASVHVEQQQSFAPSQLHGCTTLGDTFTSTCMQQLPTPYIHETTSLPLLENVEPFVVLPGQDVSTNIDQEIISFFHETMPSDILDEIDNDDEISLSSVNQIFDTSCLLPLFPSTQIDSIKKTNTNTVTSNNLNDLWVDDIHAYENNRRMYDNNIDDYCNAFDFMLIEDFMPCKRKRI